MTDYKQDLIEGLNTLNEEINKAKSIAAEFQAKYLELTNNLVSFFEGTPVKVSYHISHMPVPGDQILEFKNPRFQFPGKFLNLEANIAFNLNHPDKTLYSLILHSRVFGQKRIYFHEGNFYENYGVNHENHNVYDKMFTSEHIEKYAYDVFKRTP